MKKEGGRDKKRDKKTSGEPVKRKILIADDDENIRVTVKRLFPDYEVLGAADGKETLEAVAAEKPSVLLLDMRMPGMNGMEVLVALRESAQRPVVFMLTADDEIESADKAIDLGARSYITKPFKVEDIRQVVAMVFDELEGRLGDEDNPFKIKE